MAIFLGHMFCGRGWDRKVSNIFLAGKDTDGSFFFGGNCFVG